MFVTFILASSFKLLLLPAYRSTDFEVHRNWLAITHNLSIKKWYYEDTSQWTLDYPPFFAWFEYLLSFIAKFFDPNMLEIKNLNYQSFETVAFQRFSVIFTDLVYAYGVKECVKLSKVSQNGLLTMLLVFNVGLFYVDHIHFQYNGVMYGILLISISKMIQEKYLFSAFWFTFLINMKHIYVYLGPAYFIYLLRNYCFTKTKRKINFSVINFIKLGVIVSMVFLVSFLPFYDHIPQVLSRLFPFRRGLSHAYWAPNIWALYNTMDKMLVFGAKKLDISVINNSSMTGGLVQDIFHSILPNITPLYTMALTAIFILPGMVKLWNVDKKSNEFIRFLVLCGLTSFLFGWHVHEKAILMAIIPLSLLVIFDSEDAKVFLILSTTGFYSLFPLLFPQNLMILKALLLLIYANYSFYNFCKLYPLKCLKNTLPLLNLFETIYIFGFIPLFIYENFIHLILGFNLTLPFLPLMLTSIYCAFGVVYSWVIYYRNFMLK
nr:probable dolichyl pyrophosphate Glc1Man9GlcNAc2 alpha-1,3-glucosyltransferase [Onthophagus taurus]